MVDKSSGTINRPGIKDQVQRLLVVPPDHVLTLPRKKLRRLAMELEEDGPKLLKHLGQELQIDDDDLFNFRVSLRF